MLKNYNIVLLGVQEWPMYDHAPEVASFNRYSTFEYGQYQQLEDVVQATQYLAKNQYEIEVDHSFFPKYVGIYYQSNNLMLSGQLSNEDGISWFELNVDDASKKAIHEECTLLRKTAGQEIAWDNFDTANQLDYQADVLSLSLGSQHIDNALKFKKMMVAV